MKYLPLVIPVALAACAHNPARNVPPNGQPLRVDVGEKSYSYTVTEKIGTQTHRDASGKVVGTSDITRDRVRTRKYTVWGFYQGDEKLDELDFFTIAGDVAAAEELRSRRERGVLINRVGLGIAAAGIAGAVLMVSTEGAGRKMGASAFAIGLPLGGIMAYLGKNRVEDPSYFSLERAVQAAAAAGRRQRAAAN